MRFDAVFVFYFGEMVVILPLYCNPTIVHKLNYRPGILYYSWADEVGRGWTITTNKVYLYDILYESCGFYVRQMAHKFHILFNIKYYMERRATLCRRWRCAKCIFTHFYFTIVMKRSDFGEDMTVLKRKCFLGNFSIYNRLLDNLSKSISYFTNLLILKVAMLV